MGNRIEVSKLSGRSKVRRIFPKEKKRTKQIFNVEN